MQIFSSDLLVYSHLHGLVSSKNGAKGVTVFLQHSSGLRARIGLFCGGSYLYAGRLRGQWRPPSLDEGGWLVWIKFQISRGEAPMGLVQFGRGMKWWEKCWGWFEIQNLKVNPETPPKQHWLSKHPLNNKDVFPGVCVAFWVKALRFSGFFFCMLFRGASRVWRQAKWAIPCSSFWMARRMSLCLTSDEESATEAWTL